MTIFWIMTAALTALAGLLVLTGARRGANASSLSSEGETDRLSGVRELAELDRMKARGLLDEAGWKSARAEAGRRILAARRAEGGVKIGPRDGLWVLIAIGVTAIVSLALYFGFGRSGMADQPYEKRVAEWAAQPENLEPAQLAAVMGQVVRDKPQDVMALSMLGAARFEAGDSIGAASAFRRALALDPDNAQNWARLGESLVRASEGRIGGDAEAAFREAVKRDGDQLGARYFLGEAALARGDLDEGERMWGPILEVLAPSDPRRPELEKLLAEARAKDGGA
ncbi:MULTISPECIES: c-type cytochrome biogenesis protein CcmI [unclassified Brevundimonas]|uniref:c-type cytochrome biogenesis protein CcmI n=1 Tax=unclassified Brevundimonas TaxID=2622653 RepID=UPI0025C52BBD|nr:MULTISPECIES: c-type cytochrome biogenesis protein CcmI [unclassified Brevundimonas]